MKRHSFSMRLKIATLIGFGFSSGAQAKNYSPPKVISAMVRVDAKLKVITAHRSIYGDGCPENSLCAVRAAVANNIESVEIDVKESANGTLWAFHDSTIGRTTTYRQANGQFFNPYSTTYQVNPLVASTADTILYKLKLRDRNGAETAYYVNDIRSLLTNIRDTLPNVAVILDIKTASAVYTAATLVNDLQMRNSVVLKFSIGLMSPQDIPKNTRSVPFAITIYSGNLDAIAEKYYTQYADYNQRVFKYIIDYRVSPNYVYTEIGIKQFKTSGSSSTIEGPLANIFRALALANMAIGNFVPVPEHGSDEYFTVTGSCCTRLSQYLTSTKYFGNETRDDRPDYVAQVNTENNILTDAALQAVDYARSRGNRQNEYMMLK